MTLIPLPPQYATQYSIPIEYCIGVSCDNDEELYSSYKTFNCLMDNAITSNKTALKNRISEISNLSDNWDMYGGVAPSETVTKNAFKFIDCILSEGFNTAIRDTDIVPTPYGSIVMDFTTDKGLVSVEVGEKQIGFFTEFENDDDYASDGIDTDFRTIPEQLKKALNMLYDRQGKISA